MDLCAISKTRCDVEDLPRDAPDLEARMMECMRLNKPAVIRGYNFLTKTLSWDILCKVNAVLPLDAQFTKKESFLPIPLYMDLVERYEEFRDIFDAVMVLVDRFKKGKTGFVRPEKDSLSERSWEMLGGYENDLCKLEDEVIGGMYNYLREEGEEMKIGLPPDGLIPYLRNIHLTSWLPGYLEMLENETDEGGRPIAFPPPVFGESYMTRTSAEGSKLPAAVADEMTEGWRKWVELFVGSRAIKFPFLHQDVCRTHAWSAQIEGSKTFVLFPESETHLLYTGLRGRKDVSQVRDLDAPKLYTEFPLLKEAHPMFVTLERGDLLFIPKGWWHTTKARSRSITLGGNFVNETNVDEFLPSYEIYKIDKNNGWVTEDYLRQLSERAQGEARKES